MEIIKKIVPFEVKEFSDEGEFFTFKGYASTFGNIDRGGDIIEKGAFLDTIEEMKKNKDLLPVVWQHNHDSPIGIYTDFREDSKGLWVEGKLPRSDTFVAGRVIPQMKIGSVRKLSIGFSLWGGEGAFEMSDGIRRIKKVDLWEVSPVTIAMNNDANITEVKSICVEDYKSMSERDIEGALIAGTKFSSESAKTIVSSIKAIRLRDEEEKARRDGGKNDDWNAVINELKTLKEKLEG